MQRGGLQRSVLESCGFICAADVTQLLCPSHWSAAIICRHHSLSDRSLHGLSLWVHMALKAHFSLKRSLLMILEAFFF